MTFHSVAFIPISYALSFLPLTMVVGATVAPTWCSRMIQIWIISVLMMKDFRVSTDLMHTLCIISYFLLFFERHFYNSYFMIIIYLSYCVCDGFLSIRLFQFIFVVGNYWRFTHKMILNIFVFWRCQLTEII